MRQILLAVFLLAQAALVYGQGAGQISGAVFDSAGRPMAAASVILHNDRA